MFFKFYARRVKNRSRLIFINTYRYLWKDVSHGSLWTWIGELFLQQKRCVCSMSHVTLRGEPVAMDLIECQPGHRVRKVTGVRTHPLLSLQGTLSGAVLVLMDGYECGRPRKGAQRSAAFVRPHTRTLRRNGMRYPPLQTNARSSERIAGANRPRRKPHLHCKPRLLRPAILGRMLVIGRTTD